MYVRVSTAATEPGTKEEARRIWGELARQYEATPGFRSLFTGINADETEWGTITLWDSKEAEQASSQGIAIQAASALSSVLTGAVRKTAYEVVLTSATEVETRLQAVTDAFNRRDPNWSGAFSDDAVLVDVQTGTFSGPGGIQKAAENTLRACPDATLETTSILARGDTVVSEYTVRGTQTGPLGTPAGDIPPTGRKIEVTVCDVHHIKDGVIVRTHRYFDNAALLQQLGLMPAVAETTA